VNIRRKLSTLGLAATLLAATAIALTPGIAAASVTVGSAGSVPAGGTSSGTVSFTFLENAAAAFPGGGGTLSVTLADSLGVPTVHFNGQPSISIDPTLTGVSIAMMPNLVGFTLTIGATDTTKVEQIVVGGVQLRTDSPAAAGAITATLGGSLATSVSSTTTLASPGTVTGGGTGTHLVFATQPGGGVAGTPWTQQPVVSVQNSANTVVTTDNTTVITLAPGTNPGGGVLTCTGGNSKTVVNGVATFSGCSLNAGSASPSTLVATASTGALQATSAPFTVTGPGTASHLVFTTQPGGGTAGTAWSQQPVVAVQNASNVTNTADNSTVVTLAIGTNPGAAALTCAGGNSRTVVAGVASFSGCSISGAAASPYTLVAQTNTGATSATSAPFTITALQTSVTLSSATAIGSTTSGFSTSTKVVKKGATITLRVVTSPSLAGQSLSIFIAKKTGGVWSAFSPHASVTVGSDGVAHYVYSAGSVAWLSFQARYSGSATVSSAVAPARQARWT
jgi:hypothetical protein